MEALFSTWILIPAYAPDEQMIELIKGLRARGFERLLVVDDGGGAAYAPIFEKARAFGAHVLTHPENRGKGAALKTGFSYILHEAPAPVVTCDADGQHAVDDVERVAAALVARPDHLVLGVRDKRQMPPKSRIGNSLTCLIMGLMTGLWVRDTQTGLRGIAQSALELFSSLEGDRYEYETSVLVAARHARMPIEQVVIQTVYYDQNAASHFRPLRDGLTIYRVLLGQVGRYIGSSLLAGLVDVGIFAVLHYALPAQIDRLHVQDGPLNQLLGFLLPESFGVPALLARIVSALVNYVVNRKVVFKCRAGKRSIVYYYLLAAFVLFSDIQIMRLLGAMGMNAVLAKVIADAIMFTVSFHIQRYVVFRDRSKQIGPA